MTLGLFGALLAALAYGAATVLQAVGVRRAAALPPGTAVTGRIRAGWPYAVGLALDGLGFLASVAALRTLPLFLVESAVASSVAVTAVLSVVVLHVRLGVPEVVGLLAVAVGLTGLALTAADGPAVQPGPVATWWLLAAAVIVGLLLVIGVRDRRHGAVLLSIAAGLGFGGVGVAARLLVIPSPVWALASDGLAWALVVHAVLATVAYGTALSRGRVTTVAALTFATETVVPAAVGLVALGDRVAPGLAPWATAAFVVTLAGCIALASRAEPGEAADPDGRAAGSTTAAADSSGTPRSGSTAGHDASRRP